MEEEFLLVDTETRRTVPRAAAVLARAIKTSAVPETAFQTELVATQVEAATGVCSDLPGLRGQLAEARECLAKAAVAEGVRLVATGIPVLAGPTAPFMPGEHFARVSEILAGAVAGYEACGCHVHVGVPDPELAVAVVNHLRPWLPTLLALSANSPFDRGCDSGYGSWRVQTQARFPGFGVPPWSGSAAEYDRRLERLVDLGVLADRTTTYWLARPSPRLPTVEVRAADTAPTVDEAVLQAALVRALVRTALDDLAAGREAPPVADQVCATALWSAARHGLDGPGIHPVDERRVPATWLLDELLVRVRPALEDAGDEAVVNALVREVRHRGTGAVRQRDAAADGLPGVVDMLVRQTGGG
ncbi:glutamate--cysteine ligase [Actinomadura sp. DC4]|uniref:carboxylate-amine ligase n=1 Tax=Actinomadura sp. DC4 TaxID=3055069 RepID=UPI0025AF56CE|nr:glutamate--cysteine ligase [Actinomadura sp. DC4]MDN3353833.1 glutamate--cysteine ligase [Actinomadura sp. DC4]